MARLARLTGLLLGLGLPLAPLGAAAQDPGVRVDRSVLDALGPAPRQPLAPGFEPPAAQEPRRSVRRTPPQRPAAEETKDGVVRVPPPSPIAAAPPREEEAPRPLAPSLLPPTLRAAQAPPTAPAPGAPPPASAPADPQAAAPAPSAAAPARQAPQQAQAPAAAPPARPAAATPVAAATAAARSLRLEFAGGATELTPSAREQVLRFASGIAEDDQVRITVNAYAGGDPSDPSRARRTSLSRALAVRAALMEAGIRSTRIDVRALGLGSGDGPADRVDILAGAGR